MTNPQVTDEMVEKALDAWLASPSEDTLASIRAALTAALADHVGGWRTMDSAPKDGTHVIAAWIDSWPQHPHAEAMYYDDGGWFYSYDGDNHTRNPTHWMPLPASPLPQKEG